MCTIPQTLATIFRFFHPGLWNLAIWMSNDLRFKWFCCQLMCDSNDFVKRSFCARLLSKMKLWRSKTETKHFCETSFKKFQKWSFEAQKRSFCARLPSKMKLWRSKTKQFCETSFKIAAFKLQNKAFVRDSLQKWSFLRSKTKLFCETSFKIETLKIRKPNISARLPSKMNLWRSKTKHFCETSFKIDMLSRHLTSEFQYVLAIFKWMLQKYCACHEKVEPRHTKSCNCHAKWSLQSNTSVTWNLQPFHGFCVGGFEHRHSKARNPCACHAKRIVSDPPQIHRACQRFCNPHELLRLPRILQRVEMLAPATRKPLWTSKNVPRPSVSWAADPPQLPFFGPTFASLWSDKTMEKHSISRNSYPPKSLRSHICAVKHLCCPTSMLQDLPATFSIVGS